MMIGIFHSAQDSFTGQIRTLMLDAADSTIGRGATHDDACAAHIVVMPMQSRQDVRQSHCQGLLPVPARSAQALPNSRWLGIVVQQERHRGQEPRLHRP